MIQLIILGTTAIIVVLYILSLRRTLLKVRIENRTINPNLLWLLLIPIFNVYFHIYVVAKLSTSIAKETLSRGAELKVFRPTYGVGMIASVGFAISITFSILTIDRFAPFYILDGLCSFAGFIAGIVYWIQVFSYRSYLDKLPQPGDN